MIHFLTANWGGMTRKKTWDETSFLTTNLTNYANLSWVDACGARQNLQNFSWVEDLGFAAF
jgi:hypothetical protein